MSDSSKKEQTDPNAPQNTQDLTVFVQSLLEQMQSRFTQMSDAIIGRIDEMGTRIDDLEKSIGVLMDQTENPGDGDKDNDEAQASQGKEAN